MWAQSAAEIGRIVATARRHRNLTQSQLARALGVSQNWVSEIERGKDTAQIGKILRVLSFLGVRLEVREAPWIAAAKRTRDRDKLSASPLDDILAAHSTSARRKKPSR
jgi:HTH-type transcriptional regulator/antitoxin HipB